MHKKGVIGSLFYALIPRKQMGKMKELYIAMREGYIEDLRKDYLKAYAEDREVMRWQGNTISITYAKYLLQFTDTFLKDLTDDNIRNTNDEPERFLSPGDDR
jgi:hypothetical protein